MTESLDNLEIVWQPQPGPQTLLLTCPIFEIFFGGARGGGKSDAVLGEFASHADQYAANAIGLCVRRERTQLTELVERSKILYTPLGAKFHEQDKMWRFPNGARLKFAYLENDSDALNYQGHNYTRIYIEEMGTFPNPDPIFKLMATLRSGKGVPCKFIATGNPGGPGHLWIKQRYIDPHPGGMKILKETFPIKINGQEVSKERVFIPSKLKDNKFINNADYVGSLYLSGNEQLVKAWLHGDWDVTLGAFFQEWEPSKHIIQTFDVPKHWTRLMSMDWGSATPFSIGWWTVIPDEFDSHLDIPYFGLDQKRIRLPKGALVRYREWYGSGDPNGRNPNIGMKLTAEEIAQGIIMREGKEPRDENGRARVSPRVIDPKAFAQDGGPSHVERMAKPPYRLSFIRADNKRVGAFGHVGGWDQVRARLKGDGNRPMMYFMDNCKTAIRTLPAVQHNDEHLEDVLKEGEDHCPDEIRYACMSRPYARSEHNSIVKNTFKLRNNGLVLNDLWDSSDYKQTPFNRERIG